MCSTLLAQGSPDRLFELSAPGLDKPSIARLNDNELTIIDPTGTQTSYQRLNRYDTQDGNWISYSSREAKQVIRWPTSGTGPMQIGTLRDGSIRFATSRMKVNELVRSDSSSTNGSDGSNSGSGASKPILPDTGVEPPGMSLNLPTPSQVPQTTSQQSSVTGLEGASILPMHFGVGPTSTRQFLSLRGNNQFGLVSRATDIASAWYVASVGNGLFRIQQQVGTQWMAVGVDGRLRIAAGARHPVGLFPISNNIGQLWRIIPFQGGYCFESVHFPGMGLTWVNSSGLFLQPIVYDPWQIWYPQQPIITLPPPQFRTVQQQVIPNPDLPPVNLTLLNSHRDEVLLLFADRRMPDNPQKIRIPAGKTESISIQRDAGATIVESVEIMDTFGNWSQQQNSIPIPPAVLYDISVYEIFLQSIAIDRTGKSPNPIEDINMQPRSIGYFLVPPGDALREDSVLDVYKVATNAQNPGAVRRLSPTDVKQGDASGDQDPLRAILQQFQKQRAAF
jgi:hypothetical protein